MAEQVTLIGFGEAGQAFAGAEGWRGETRAYDKLTDNPGTAGKKLAEYRAASVIDAPSIGAAVRNAPTIISLVTADQALQAARVAAAWLNAPSLYLDMNSVAPATKKWKPKPMSRAVSNTSTTERLITVRRLRRMSTSEESSAAL